jgi:hypothetical protein
MSYAKTAKTADAAFRRKGQLMTLTLKTKGPYINGAVTYTTTTVTVWGIETGVTAHDLGMGNVKGTLIQAGDRKLTISALAATGGALPVPQLEDTILVGAKVYALKNVDALQPGGVPVLYSLVGR